MLATGHWPTQLPTNTQNEAHNIFLLQHCAAVVHWDCRPIVRLNPPFGGGIYCQQRQCLTQTITCIHTVSPAVVITKQCCCHCTTTVTERSKLTHAVLGFAFRSFKYFINLERERRRIRYLLNTKRGWGLGELGGCLCVCRDLCVCVCARATESLSTLYNDYKF